MNDDPSVYRLRRKENKIMIDNNEPIHKQHPRPWWTTDCEKNFLDGLGKFALTYRLTAEDMQKRRRLLLFKYRDSVFKRKVWDTIDHKQIIAYVEELIKNG
jgi:hypothetical protein